MGPKETPREWEDRKLALPIAGKVSGEDIEHVSGDTEYQATVLHGQVHEQCACDRCKIIRIKRRRAFLWLRSKCEKCRELHTSLFGVCEKCRKEEP